MRKIENLEDQMNGVVIYEVADGKWVTFDARAVRDSGLWMLLEAEGYKPPTERVPVMQYGRRVGTLPGSFDPDDIRSRSFLYDPRPGDLRREGDAWVAHRTLGVSDLDMIPGFVRDNGE